MGIPKFFRWIAERYPMVLQEIDETQIPVFDNLYLDMNSIIHNCTHGNDVDANLSEEEMYKSMFAYIEHLFQKIKPKKYFFMAIDGVAPRAKMNQQRSRRFKTALEAEEEKLKAIKNDLPYPDNKFDTNAITPGTEFMANLSRQLNYFINKKISEDSDWQRCTVILSGHEVPGEGEHKIMEFIRAQKSNKSYSPKVRHCLYGLDADLIMLGLLTHDPYFALLREEVTFGRSKKTSTELVDQKFFLFHLTLLREYIEVEFENIKAQIPFEYSFERVIDDFVLLAFFIGNDFLPNLPNLVINDGALVLVFEIYRKALPHCDGYINNNGTINLPALKIVLQYLEEFEFMFFDKEGIDLQLFNERLERGQIQGVPASKGSSAITKHELSLYNSIKSFFKSQLKSKNKLSEPVLKLNYINDSESQFIKSLCKKLQLQSSFTTNDLDEDVKNTDKPNEKVATIKFINFSNQNSDSESDEDEDLIDRRALKADKLFQKYENFPVLEDSQNETDSGSNKTELELTKFEKWKDTYYKSKVGFSYHDTDKLRKMAENYVQGLQWVLYYYYRGCPSWSWFYAYHYSPKISDIKLGLNVSLEFNKGHPFHPFEQLMSVLPSRSKSLVPKVYWPLMCDEEVSPIIDFYPQTFQTDQNGKTAPWEAVVLIPFVDETRLIKAMAPLEKFLTKEEKARNSFGIDKLCVFDPTLDFVYPSPFPGIFNDIESCHCHVEDYYIPQVDPKNLRYGLLEGAKLGIDTMAGFPSLDTIPHTFSLEKNVVNVFNQNTKNDSVICTIANVYSNMTLERLVDDKLGKRIFVNWPYLREGRVVGISDGLINYHMVKKTTFGGEVEEIARDVYSDREMTRFEAKSKRLQNYFLKKMGVNVGEVKFLVEVEYLKGMRYTDEGDKIKEYGGSDDSENDFILQTTVSNVVNEDERTIPIKGKSIEEEFPIGSNVIFLGDYSYGRVGTIKGYSGNLIDLIVQKLDHHSRLETIGSAIANDFKTKNYSKYYPSYEAANILGISSFLLSRITSRLLIFDPNNVSIRIGLELKFEERKKKVLGYSSRNDRGWSFSEKAIHVIEEYIEKFPEVFEGLSKKQQLGKITVVDIFGENFEERLTSLKAWLKKQECFTSEAVPLSSEQFDEEYVKILENFIQKNTFSERYVKKLVSKVPRSALLKPSQAKFKLYGQTFHLGDRVEYVLDSGKVPIFSYGTVVGLTTSSGNSFLDVVFDEPFITGTKLNGRLKTSRGMSVDIYSVLNISTKHFVFHSKTSGMRNKANINNNNNHTNHNNMNNRFKANVDPLSSIFKKNLSISTPKYVWNSNDISSKPIFKAPEKILTGSSRNKEKNLAGSVSHFNLNKNPKFKSESHTLLDGFRTSNKGEVKRNMNSNTTSNQPSNFKSFKNQNLKNADIPSNSAPSNHTSKVLTSAEAAAAAATAVGISKDAIHISTGNNTNTRGNENRIENVDKNKTPLEAKLLNMLKSDKIKDFVPINRSSNNGGLQSGETSQTGSNSFMNNITSKLLLSQLKGSGQNLPDKVYNSYVPTFVPAPGSGPVVNSSITANNNSMPVFGNFYPDANFASQNYGQFVQNNNLPNRSDNIDDRQGQYHANGRGQGRGRGRGRGRERGYRHDYNHGNGRGGFGRRGGHSGDQNNRD